METAKAEGAAKDKLYVATQWQLIWRKFIKHKLALVGVAILVLLYTVGLFAELVATQDASKRNTRYIYTPPQKIHFAHEGRFQLRPFVYGLNQEVDPETWRRSYVEQQTEKHDIYFFVRGDSYKLWNLFETDIHLFGVENGPFYLAGSDGSGRDIFSRTVYATRISLSVGLIGVFLSFVLGCLFGGISGYYGGVTDLIIQRVIEFLISIPSIPLWMAFAAALPKNWSTLQVYFAITIILSVVGWCGLARVVRGKFLELRQQDFVTAARLAGASDANIILRHLLPGFMSYLVVSITLAIPAMIIGETALSFLGIGLRPPVVSWGVLLKDAQNIGTLALHPWLLIPGLFVISSALAFNFVGDGLRDAADPYQ